MEEKERVLYVIFSTHSFLDPRGDILQGCSKLSTSHQQDLKKIAKKCGGISEIENTSMDNLSKARAILGWYIRTRPPGPSYKNNNTIHILYQNTLILKTQCCSD